MRLVRSPTASGQFVVVAVCLLLPVWPLLAQEPGVKSGFSTDPADQAACRVQLNRIFGAIQEYRKQHGGNPPDSLSDLTPDYLHDPGVLVCPFVQKRGGLRTWNKRSTELSPDPYTSYSYEFPPVPVDHYRWRGLPKKTWREIKERQSEVVGSVVPIVRCHDHQPTLNLAVGGPIYESDLYWERNFVEDEDFLLMPVKLFSSPPSVRPPGLNDFPPRNPRANPRLLDLTAFYNASLTNSWQGFPGNSLDGLPLGIREFDGVQFDVRGVIQLRGTEIPASFPRQVTGIHVRQKCARIHFLHAVSFHYKPGTVQACYSVHYADGELEEFPVIYGQHIADWWCGPQDPASPTDAKVAWTGQNEAARAYGVSLRLYHAVWENPLKSTEIATISFDALSKKFVAGPFVVAITLE